MSPRDLFQHAYQTKKGLWRIEYFPGSHGAPDGLTTVLYLDRDCEPVFPSAMIEKGMIRQEVIDLLGEPTFVPMHPHGPSELFFDCEPVGFSVYLTQEGGRVVDVRRAFPIRWAERLVPAAYLTERGFRRVDYWNRTYVHDSGPEAVFYFDKDSQPVDPVTLIKEGMSRQEVIALLGPPALEKDDRPNGKWDLAFKSAPRGFSVFLSDNAVVMEIEVGDDLLATGTMERQRPVELRGALIEHAGTVGHP
jgi:hypothetical protein